MKQTIEIPKGYDCIDFESSDIRYRIFGPKSWREYCETKPREGMYYVSGSGVEQLFNAGLTMRPDEDRNLIPTKEYAFAIAAIIRLLNLRQAWVGDWKATTTDENGIRTTAPHATIVVHEGVKPFIYESDYPGFNLLTFPTREMAEAFLDTFGLYIEEVTPII